MAYCTKCGKEMKGRLLYKEKPLEERPYEFECLNPGCSNYQVKLTNKDVGDQMVWIIQQILTIKKQLGIKE